MLGTLRGIRPYNLVKETDKYIIKIIIMYLLFKNQGSNPDLAIF